MERNLLIGVDVGTTSTKVLVADPAGVILASGTANYPLLFPNVGWAEQSAEELFAGIKRAIKQALSLLPTRVGEICAISLSTQRDTMVITDENNVPLRNAITWMDSRAGKECDALRDALGEDTVYHITGVPISTIWTSAFMLWVRDNEPEVWEKASCFGLVHDYIMCCFGAKEHYLDTTNACQTMLYDFINDRWSGELMDYIGLDESRLPKLVPPAMPIGTISEEIAQELGLPRDVQLISGGGDQQCAMIGAGAIRLGDTELCMGTAANILALLASPQFDPKGKLICHRALVPGRYLMEGAMLSGRHIEWLADVFFPGESRNVFYRKLDDEVENHSRPGANGLLITPHFEGATSPQWDPDARGFCLGLTMSTTRADICRAIYEGIALETKKNLDMMNELGTGIRQVIISGGGSKSPVWMQIMADALGIPVLTLANNECAAMGSVILAGVGSGIFRSIEDGVAKMVSVARVYSPVSENTKLYGDLLKLNCACCDALTENDLYSESIRFKKAYGSDEAE